MEGVRKRKRLKNSQGGDAEGMKVCRDGRDGWMDEWRREKRVQYQGHYKGHTMKVSASGSCYERGLLGRFSLDLNIFST